MVSLTRTKTKPSDDATAAVLAVVKAAGERLPDRTAPHLDRLFALECAAKAGPAGAAYVERLREAQRQAEWWMDDSWEDDVPHAAVLGQALSARDALGQDIPPGWTERFVDVIAMLGERPRGRFNPLADGRLVAALLRGLAVSGLTTPDWLLEGAGELAGQRSGVVAQAELAEALTRQQQKVELIRSAAGAAFNGAGAADPNAPYVRWWLATKVASTPGGSVLAPELVSDARLQSLVLAAPDDAHAAAMLLEVAGATASDLVIESAESVASLRAQVKRSALLRLALFEWGFFAGLLVLVLTHLRSVSNFIAKAVGVHDPENVRKVVAGLGVFLVGLCLIQMVSGVCSALGKNPPAWLSKVETAASVVAGAIAGLSV